MFAMSISRVSSFHNSRSSSGLVLVCPEYNATIAPALTNLMDYFPPDAYRHKPVSIVNYSMGASSFHYFSSRLSMFPFV